MAYYTSIAIYEIKRITNGSLFTKKTLSKWGETLGTRALESQINSRGPFQTKLNYSVILTGTSPAADTTTMKSKFSYHNLYLHSDQTKKTYVDWTGSMPNPQLHYLEPW